MIQDVTAKRPPANPGHARVRENRQDEKGEGWKNQVEVQKRTTDKSDEMDSVLFIPFISFICGW